jgi:hypothetical protein
MGYAHISLRGFNIMHRIDNNWVPASAILDLTDTCYTQSVTLSSVSQAATAGAVVVIRTLRRTLGRYFISFRNGNGYDGLQSSTYLNKVHVHYQVSSSTLMEWEEMTDNV